MGKLENLKVVSLEAENIKRIKAVAIRPDGNLVVVAGENGEGKTSVLDSIWWAIKGARNIQAVPIRAGCESARIRLDLGEVIVTRTFKKVDDPKGYTTSLKVVAADGSKFEGGDQAILDALVGDIAFDPGLFMAKDAKAQFDALRAFVPGVDFDQIAKDRQRDFDERTIKNRQAKDYEAQAMGVTVPPGPVPKRVDLSALEARLAQAGKHNTDIATRRANRDAAKARIEAIEQEIARLNGEAAALRERLADAPLLGEEIDAQQLVDEIAAARASNAHVDAADRRAALMKQASDASDAAAALTKAIEKRDADKQAAIAAAKMPVPGLGFGDECVLLDGVPFEQASAAQQLRAAVAIAAALNPRLRIIQMRDGSKLDTKAMTALAEFADANNMQVWIERVGSAGQGFEMVNGELRGHETTAPEEEDEAV